MFVYGFIEEVNFVGQGNGMDPVRLSNLVETGKVVNDVKDDTGLYRGDARFGGLQFPKALRFGKKAIMERMRIPIFGAV